MATKPAARTNAPAPMTVTVRDGRLIIDAPITAPRASASGKSMVVITTSGNIVTGAEYDGNPLIMGLNVYYRA